MWRLVRKVTEGFCQSRLQVHKTGSGKKKILQVYRGLGLLKPSV